MHQMHHMAPWVPTFSQAIENELAGSNNSPPFISFQLATIDKATGFPKNRTLVYRGWLFDDKSSNVITFTTDKRMSKYAELEHDDRFEAVFWFPTIKKQFRFRGRARIVDDKYIPTINPSITNGGSSEINEAAVARPQEAPIHATLCSPSLRSAYSQSSTDLSYTNLARLQYHPPSQQEWADEVQRSWDLLSKNLKKSFRRPSPKTPLTDENQKKIDSIGRGVDGKKDVDGLKNFAVVAMFIEHVDFFEQDKDRRYIYDKDGYDQWIEQEVCP